jgi:hypothetical protein
VDAFKTVVLTTLLVSIVAIGFIGYVIVDAIESAKIPDQQYGTVSSIDPVTDGRPASYIVTLEDNRQLYITTNTTIYETIELDQAYLFSCRIDAKNNMVIIDSAWQTNRTTT